MDLYRLDKTNYIPDKIIEGGEKGYSSLIWTERYIDSGEFELKTPYVLKTMKLLPEGSLLSHRETDEVMMVDTLSVDVNEDGFAELTIKGKSLTNFLNHRYLEGPYPKKKYKMARNYTAADAALVILWNCLVNPSEEDVTRAGPWSRSTLDNIPDSVVTDSTTIDGTSKRRWLEGGQAYPQIISLIRQNKIGFRTIRPNSGSGKVISVSKSAILADSGAITRTTDSNITHLRWDLYNGVDRRSKGPTAKEVIFNYDSGHIDNPSYLWSVADYKTMAYVVSEPGIKKVYRDVPGAASLSGFDRRVIWVDGGEVADPDFPKDATDAEKDAIRAQNKQDFLDDRQEAADVALEKTDKVELMDGNISPDCPYRYRRDYYLGDKVTMVGQYEFNQTMRVAEYVRTEDAEGDRGFPGLVVTL